ncbi:MAG: hypothetical protein ACFFD4_39770, partial [Candidatus Odinarchaeota archaeon]
MDEYDLISQKKAHKILYESLLIYLACWCDDWLLSDLYDSKDGKFFITGYKNLYRVTLDRIELLIDKKIPLTVERVDPDIPKQGSLVSLDRTQVINDFMEEIGFSSATYRDKLTGIIMLAVPLIRIQADFYYQSQKFANNQLKKVIEVYIAAFENCPNCIKYFPVFLSFQALIMSDDAIDDQQQIGQRWLNAIEESSTVKFKFPHRVLGYFISKLPGFGEVLGTQGFDPSLLPSLFALYPRETALDMSIESF